jgi:hypothetical protein
MTHVKLSDIIATLHSNRLVATGDILMAPFFRSAPQDRRTTPGCRRHHLLGWLLVVPMGVKLLLSMLTSVLRMMNPASRGIGTIRPVIVPRRRITMIARMDHRFVTCRCTATYHRVSGWGSPIVRLGRTSIQRSPSLKGTTQYDLSFPTRLGKRQAINNIHQPRRFFI